MNGLRNKAVAWLGALAMGALMLTGASLAQADELTPQQAFERADLDNDGNVDIEEFRGRKIEVFILLDANGDGLIVLSEVPEKHKDKFPKVDKDKDERVDLREYLVYVMPAFWLEHDMNKDNVLTLDEVEAAAKK
jgi:Ca2+-binding EF-hand superfamily protein